jgi:ABC-type transporter Mla subunit MlaD
MMAEQLDASDPDSLMAIVRGQLDATDARSLLGKIHVSLEDINMVTRNLRTEFDPSEKAVLIAKLHAILDNVNSATGLLRGEMDKVSDGAMLAKFHQTLDTLNAGLHTVVTVLNENHESINATIAHIRATSEVLERQIAARIARQLDPAEAAGLLAKVHVAIDRLGVSLQDANAITAATRETVVLNREQLNRMITNMKVTSDHLKAASKEIRRNPWRLFYQPTMQEAAEANVFDTARAFAEAATRLDDAMGRLQAISNAPSSAPAGADNQLAEILEQLKQTFSQFTKVEQALWQQLNIK